MEMIKGSILRIGEDRYDITRVMKEIDKYDTKNKKLIGEHLQVEIKPAEEKSEFPTHVLKIYSDRALLVKITKSNSQYIEKPKQKGIGIFKYIYGTEVPLNSITVESQK